MVPIGVLMPFVPSHFRGAFLEAAQLVKLEFNKPGLSLLIVAIILDFCPAVKLFIQASPD